MDSLHVSGPAAPPDASQRVVDRATVRRGAVQRWSRRWWQGDDEGLSLLVLLLCGILIEIFLVVLTRRFWLPRFFPGPGFSLGFPQQMTGNWSADFKWLGFILGAPFLPFVVALWCARELGGRLARLIVFGFAALFGLTLVPLYPITAADLFHYLADARTLWVYHQDPLLVPPIAHPFVIGISWMQQPSPYGPLWQLLALLPVSVTGNHWVAGVIGFKLLACAAYLATAVLIYLTVRRTWPGRELVAALVFAWSPFVVFRAVGNGHNDVVMAAFAAGAFYCVAARRWRWVLPLLALSIMVKYATALLALPLVVYAWRVTGRSERRDLAIGAAIAALLTVGVFVPFWSGFDTFKTFVQNTNLVITSVPQIVQLNLRPDVSPVAIDPGVRRLGYLVFIPIYLAVLTAIAVRPSFRSLVAGSALSFIAYLALCTWWFRPWYFLWLLPLAALLPSFWWTALAVATTFGTTFFDPIEQYRNHWSWVAANDLRSFAAPVASAFLPLLLVLIAGLAVTGAWTMMQEHRPPPMLDG